ncbi:MAG: phenylalanine--tRNA ligase subunit beta [Thermaurantimonas sp.]|uniref:phenylalanine--tRNA ligase subunit beta n=1 Tax=Thermaurantimonas sp. TaxID=2681568 RepID=UPI0039198A95
MKISYNWLKEYIDLKGLTVNEVGELLTEIGLECEAVTPLGRGPEIDDKVVVGFVVSAQKHPNADKLTLCQVDTGDGQLLQIVCGAPNVAEGQKIPVALHGATLRTYGGEVIKIKKGKIRGEISEGMICAEDELGISADHSGIMVLDESYELGAPLAKYIASDADYILEIGLTPNRADAMSHYGVARDLFAALAHRKKKVELSLPSVAGFKVSNTQLTIDIEIADRRACKRYAGVSITGVKVGPSPEWLQKRLKSIGLNPINNVVDVTNFVLHECGHPLHAFDADRIAGRKIVVRKAEEGEKFITLDGVERTLSAEDLMICDAEKPLVLAGIYGGLYSGVNEQTTNVFLESAVFDTVHIRRSARRHGLQTDASYRYERGVDPEMTIYALKRAANLIREVAGGEISMNIHDEYPAPITPHMVDANLQRIRRFIGKKDITNGDIKSILASLEIKILAEIEDTLRLEVPSYRVDVQREADVVEEILRIYGLDNVEPPRKIKFAWHQPGPDHTKVSKKADVSKLLVSRGYSETMNNSLTSAEPYNEANKAQLIELINPLSNELAVLRGTMLFGLLENIRFNINRQIPDLRLFEFGKTYKKLNDRYAEDEFLALVLTGSYWSDTWLETEKKATFYHLLNDVEAILQYFKLHKVDKRHYQSDEGEGITIKKDGKHILILLAVSGSILKKFDIEQPVYYSEINWNALLSAAGQIKTTFTPLPKFPEVVRDLALVIDRTTTYQALEQAVLKLNIKELRDITLFDVYEGKNLPEGKKSYAMRFTLRHDEKTLNDPEIEQIMQRILGVLQAECGAMLR